MSRAAPARRRPRKAARQRDLERLLRPVWLGLVAIDLAVLVLLRLHPLAERAAPAAGGVLAVLLAVGLSGRTGGRPLLPFLLSAAYAAVAVVTMDRATLAGGAVGTAVLAATISLLMTTPAATFRRAAAEVVFAGAVATAGGLGVDAFGGSPHPTRFGYVVFGITLFAAFVLVYRLGAGLHGLGRRGYLVAGGAVVLLAVALAYSEALGRWGSPEMVHAIDRLRSTTRDHLHAVPHPMDTLLGIPALCWGVFVRARRRQGWWVCAFGAGLTAPAAASFVPTGVSTTTMVLGAVYTLVLGLLIGYVVIRVDQSLTGSVGRRARRDEEASAHRPEPGRLEPLH